MYLVWQPIFFLYEYAKTHLFKLCSDPQEKQTDMLMD